MVQKKNDRLQEFVEAYLKRGFGSMNKNDFEVWIFSELLQRDFAGKSNYAISKELMIPENKVKRLRYEAGLKYILKTDEEYYRQLDECLKKCRFRKANDTIQFSVEDLSLRRFLDAKLKEIGRFTDSSFNSEIVSLALIDLEGLLSKSTEGKEILARIKKETGKGFLQFAKEHLVDELASVATSSMISLSFDALRSWIS